MTTKLKLSNTKDILIDSTIPEILIKSLVEEIYDAEEKISQINNSKENSPNGLTVNNQKLFELKSLQNNLEHKLFSLNNNYQSEISLNKNQILSQKNIINDLDISIKEYQNKLLKFNTIDFKSPLLSKYALENDINNKILSQEQINEIYLNNKNKNENEIKQLIKEIEINKASESVIINNKKEINKRLEQINENIKMLKEEKLSIKYEIIDIISYKESLELINKNDILNIIKNVNLKNNMKNVNKINNDLNSNEEDDDIVQIENYLYELAVIEPNNVANKLYEELSDLFRVIGNYKIKKYKNSNSSYIINDINSVNNSKNNTKINFYISNKTKEMNTIDIFENNSNYNNSNLNNKGKSLSNSCIAGIKEKKFINDKYILKNLVKEELKNFIKLINNNIIKDNDNEGTSLIINNFLNKIVMIIINQFNNNENEIKNYTDLQNELIIYLSYFFKIIYYDYIIENKLKFINKEYKAQKKEYKKLKDIINNELLKLESKYDEIKSKKMYKENQLTLLNKSNQIKINDNNYNNLSQDEKSYIQICLKINSIIKQKEEIEKKINNFENDIINRKIKYQNEIDTIKNELEKINNEINNINNLNEINTLKNNENIIKYRKIIDDKFNAIKEQLKIYKEKYGTNLSLYNKFINDINLTIQETYNKSFFGLDINKNNNIFNNCYNNGIIMIGTENKNNKYINLNMIENLKNKNNSDNNIINSKLFITDRKQEKNSFNKSLNYNNKDNNDIDKNVDKLLNKTVSNLKQSSDFNLSSNDLYLGDKKNRNFINNIKIEKINRSFYQYSSLSNKNKKENKENSHKKRNTINNFDLFNNKILSINNLNKENIFNERRNDSNNKIINEINSKTFSSPFFRKQSKSQGGIPESIPFNNNTKTTKNSIFNIGIHKCIPRGSKINNENLKNEQNIKNSIKNIKIRLEKNYLINNNNNNNFLYKLNPLTKITFCYYREISSNNGVFIKYNPLKNISSKELCEYPYNFIKSTISLNKNYKSIKIVPSTQLEPIDIKISMIENTVVSSAVKSIIDIHRNYYKWKENNKGNNIINEFIEEQIKKYENLNQEDIEKCIINKNFNFSIILKSGEKEKYKNRIEFIICSYDEFKMWINGMAYIIKNKNNIIKLINQEKIDSYN